MLASITKKGEIERELGLHLVPIYFWWLNCPTQIFGLTCLPKCIDYTGVKGSHSANKKTKSWVQQKSKGPTEGTSGLAPRIVRCATGQCPVHQRTPTRTRHLRECWEALRYNSPDCPVCTGLSGATPEQRLSPRQRLSAAHLMRALRAQKSGAPILAHRTANSTCPVCTGHPGGPTSQKLQRSESNGSDDVAGGTGLSGVHRTVRCAIEQTASQRPLLVVGAINTPTTPPFIASKFSTSQLLQEL